MALHPEYAKRLVMEELRQALETEGLFDERVQLEEAGFPNLFVRFKNRLGNFRLLHFECTNYNYQPVAVDPVHPVTRQPLSSEEWMRRQGGAFAFPGHHMRGGRPFICLEGTRDYYTHEGHRPSLTGQRWETYRNELNLATLIRTLKARFAAGEWE